MDNKLMGKVRDLITKARMKELEKKLVKCGPTMDAIRLNQKIMEHAEFDSCQPVKIHYAPGIIVLTKISDEKEGLND